MNDKNLYCKHAKLRDSKHTDDDVRDVCASDDSVSISRYRSQQERRYTSHTCTLKNEPRRGGRGGGTGSRRMHSEYKFMCHSIPIISIFLDNYSPFGGVLVPPSQSN